MTGPAGVRRPLRPRDGRGKPTYCGVPCRRRAEHVIRRETRRRRGAGRTEVMTDEELAGAWAALGSVLAVEPRVQGYDRFLPSRSDTTKATTPKANPTKRRPMPSMTT